MTKRILSTLVALLLVMLMTACGVTTPSVPASGPTQPRATEQTPPAQPDPEPDPEADPEPVGTEEATAENEPIGDSELVVYSGRSEELVGPIIERFEEQSGLDVNVKYGDTTELASTILEEGANSPADVFFAQDAGALGALTNEGVFAELPTDIISLVDARFRAPENQWVGISARARVVVYNTEELSEADLPDSILDFTDSTWSGRIGWAPTNASFQSFVTAMRASLGEEAAREWLEGIQANEPRVYANNTAVLEAVGSGELSVGFVNHYYLFRKLAESPDYPAANYFFGNGDVGGLVNVAGVGILNTAQHPEAAHEFVEFLLAEEAQHYFSDETKEYPLLSGIAADPILPPLDSLGTPPIDLNALADLQGTLELLQSLGIL
jgi:iron(III) transport system substrate-binding protein